jgi:hypothetical protein
LCAVNIGADMQYQSGKCGESGAVPPSEPGGLSHLCAGMPVPDLSGTPQAPATTPGSFDMTANER